jgi:hypothetical protein
MARCTRYNIMWSSLSVTCDRSLVFSRYSGILRGLLAFLSLQVFFLIPYLLIFLQKKTKFKHFCPDGYHDLYSVRQRQRDYHEMKKRPSWSWSYGSWIYNYLCLSPLRLWVQTPFMARCSLYNITLCDKVCQWLATVRWFSPGTAVSSTNKTDLHDITEILLKVALNNINQTRNKTNIP